MHILLIIKTKLLYEYIAVSAINQLFQMVLFLGIYRIYNNNNKMYFNIIKYIMLSHQF